MSRIQLYQTLLVIQYCHKRCIIAKYMKWYQYLSRRFAWMTLTDSAILSKTCLVVAQHIFLVKTVIYMMIHFSRHEEHRNEEKCTIPVIGFSESIQRVPLYSRSSLLYKWCSIAPQIGNRVCTSPKSTCKFKLPLSKRITFIYRQKLWT